MGNSQSIGSGIGDIFWSDNPHRRDRCFQLERDCRNAIDEFNNTKAKYDKDVVRVKQAMDNYLKDHGFDSVAHLDTHVQGVLNGKELEDWKSLKTALSANNFISDLVMAVSGIAVVAGGATIGVLVLVGVMTGPVGWAALGTVATIAAAVGAVVLVWGVIEGGIERSRLRDTIESLFNKRQEVYCQLRIIQAYKSWIAAFEMFFLDEDFKKKPQLFASRYQTQFEEDTARAKASAVQKELEQLDKRREAWTNEDPKPGVFAIKIMDDDEKPERHIIVSGQEDMQYNFKAQILEQHGRAKCIFQAIDTGEKWTMTAEAPVGMEDNKKLSLGDVKFKLVKDGLGGQVLEHCKITFPL